MTRCAACPCPPDVACLGPTSHGIFCDWSADGLYASAVINRSRIALGLPPREPEPRPPEPDWLTVLRGRATQCPHRTPTGSCSCSGYCGLGRGFPHPETGRMVASLDDCAACPDLPP